METLQQHTRGFSQKEALTNLIENRATKELVEVLFGVTLTESQTRIVDEIVYGYSDAVISAYTRHGKSFSVAIGINLFILFNKNKRVIINAPTSDQADIIGNYIADFMLRSPFMINVLDLDVKGKERLKKEISRKRKTFRNGCELRILTAHGTGERLMGFGGDLIIDDEDCLIEGEVFRQKISRMKGDSPNSRIIHIGNPWHRDNQMYAAWINPNVVHIHIPWQTGVREGRVTEKFIEEQRAELTEIEFTILYDAEFPEESEDQLIKFSWIQKAINKEFRDAIIDKPVHGLDVAEMGMDLTVLMKGKRNEFLYYIEKIESWGKKDTMETVGLVMPHILKDDIINIDSIGVGKGVHDRLKELGYNAVEIKVGRSPESTNPMEDLVKKSRFLNKKAEFYWRLRTLFEEGKISIPKHNTLQSQLLKIKWRRTSDGAGKIKIIDPEDKSPDFADALMLMCAEEKQEFVMRFV